MKKKTILVTGGAGFIGSNLCERLLEQGHRVIALDNLITGKLQNIKPFLNTSTSLSAGNKNFKFIKADITNKFSIFNFQFSKLDQIYNLASPASPIDYQQSPLETLLSGSVGVQNILDLARKYKARILHSSTSEVYGDPLVHPQKESYFGNVNPYGPRSCYDESKRYAEALIYTYRRKYNLDTGIVRVFNTFGEKMRPDDGRVVSNFIVQALQNQPLTIYGTGTQTRSFCYVSDMVEGLVKMMESQEEGPINLGNPTEFRVIDLAKKIIQLTVRGYISTIIEDIGQVTQSLEADPLQWGNPQKFQLTDPVKKFTKLLETGPKIVYKPLPPDDPKQRRPDIALAKKKLKFSPKVPLDEGLKLTIEWFKNKINPKF